MLIKRGILGIIVLLFFTIIGFIYKDNLFSARFVDEEYNFAIGRFLTKGELLYEDIITNHQPITHILSFIVQSITNPDSAFLMIRDHRIFVFLYSLFWAIFLSIRFGLPVLFFVIPYELTKGFLFGNLFLAETFSTYPLMYLIAIIITRPRKINILELIFIGIVFGLCAFLFGPLVPLLGLLAFFIVIQQKGNRSNVVLLLASGTLLVFLFISQFISINGYLHYYYIINLTYTVPNYHQSYYNESWIFTILKSFITPLFAFTKEGTTPTLSIIRIASILLLINIIFLVFKKEFRKIGVIVILLGLANIRFVYPGNEHFAAGFLPWYSSLLFITSLVAWNNFKKNPLGLKLVFISLICLIFFISIKEGGTILLKNRNTLTDYTVNFSTHIDRGNAVKIMRNDKDILFVSPDAWLVYWQSDTNHIPKLFGYYPWMAGIPNLHSAILENFDKNPPTFFHCKNCSGLDLERYLDKYVRVKKSGSLTNLFVLRRKVTELTREQERELKLHQFTF